jgi:hypothetical protein
LPKAALGEEAWTVVIEINAALRSLQGGFVRQVWQGHFGLAQERHAAYSASEVGGLGGCRFLVLQYEAAAQPAHCAD